MIEPLETIYTELKKQDEYSIFFNLYDSFGEYIADNTLSNSYAAAYGVDTLYQYSTTVCRILLANGLQAAI